MCLVGTDGLGTEGVGTLEIGTVEIGTGEIGTGKIEEEPVSTSGCWKFKLIFEISCDGSSLSLVLPSIWKSTFG